MKILYVHNDYARSSGEENAAESIAALLKEHGHEVSWFRRSSAELQGLPGKIKGFFTGITKPAEVRKLGRVLDEYRPDAVQVQYVYPLYSLLFFRKSKNGTFRSSALPQQIFVTGEWEHMNSDVAMDKGLKLAEQI